jgi:hypothetical protein
MTTKYSYTNDMQEISGMGEGYEQTCRKMVIAGLEFWDTQPATFYPRYREFENVYGLCIDDNEDAKKLSEAVVKAVEGDCSGAMHQATISHILFIKKNGWEKYKEEMSKKK